MPRNVLKVEGWLRVLKWLQVLVISGLLLSLITFSSHIQVNWPYLDSTRVIGGWVHLLISSHQFRNFESLRPDVFKLVINHLRFTDLDLWTHETVFLVGIVNNNFLSQICESWNRLAFFIFQQRMIITLLLVRMRIHRRKQRKTLDVLKVEVVIVGHVFKTVILINLE